MWVQTSGTPSAPQPNLAVKSPPNVPFAEVLLKNLGKTPQSRGRGHSWRWRRGDPVIDPLPVLLLLLRSTTRYLRGEPQSPSPPCRTPWCCSPLLEAPLESTLWPRGQHPKASYLHLR